MTRPPARAAPVILAPSALSADVSRLGAEIGAVEAAGADGITAHAEAGPHLDRAPQRRRPLAAPREEGDA